MTNQSSLVQLLYVSCSRVPSSGVDEILAVAERRNPSLNLTGALLYTGQYFFQALEGPKNVVESMLEEITGDPRHHSLRVLHCVEVKEREFPKWSMGSVILSNIDQLIAPLFTVHDVERAHIISKMTLQSLRRIETLGL